MNFFKKIANKVKDTFNTKKMQLEAIVSTAVAGGYYVFGVQHTNHRPVHR